ncbi:MAG: hypothetical protein QGH76_06045 [Phycisphaerales bacterium]|nr:hypothetical protein [Phycisphaerales bacterium]
MGSDRGYRQLAASPGVSDSEGAAIAGLDVGLPAGGRADRLGSFLVVVCRPLPSGRIGLTRCVAGGLDDAGRRTIQFRTMIFHAAEWILEAKCGLSGLVGAAYWADRAFEQGTCLVVEANLVDRSPPSRATLALACMLRDGPRPVLLRADAATNGIVMAMVSQLSDVDAAQLCWGLGLGRAISGMDVATLGIGGQGIDQPIRQIDLALADGIAANQTHSLPPLQPLMDDEREDGGLTCQFQGSDGVSRNRIAMVVGVILVLASGWIAGQWWWDSLPQPQHAPPAALPVEPNTKIGSTPPIPREVEIAPDPPQESQVILLPVPIGTPSPPSELENSESPIPLQFQQVPMDNLERLDPVVTVTEPANVAEILDQLNAAVLEVVCPVGTIYRSAPSRGRIKALARQRLASLWNRDLDRRDAFGYLDVLANVEAKFEEASRLIGEEGVKHWGTRPATERWLRAAGRNEVQIGRRMRELDRCSKMVARISRTADALRELVLHEEFDDVRRFVLRRWFASGYAEAMTQSVMHLEQARRLVEDRLGNDWPGRSSQRAIDLSLEALKARRDGRPDQGDR